MTYYYIIFNFYFHLSDSAEEKLPRKANVENLIVRLVAAFHSPINCSYVSGSSIIPSEDKSFERDTTVSGSEQVLESTGHLFGTTKLL